MPLYDFTCANDHTTESRQAITVEVVACPICGTSAQRVAVYRDQYMQAETGPVGGKKNPVPPSDTFYGKEVSEFVEASEQVADAYQKQETETGQPVKAPNLFKRGLREANRRNKKVKTL